MTHTNSLARRQSHIWPNAAIAALLLAPILLHAQARKNPASRMYVSDVSGESTVETGERIQNIAKRSVYSANGSIIETRRSSDPADKKPVFSVIVFSNGTGAFYDIDTRVEMKRFLQEPFTPNRNDLEVEPSISQTQALVSRGIVGLCNSKLVSGSNMTYSTPHSSISIRGRKLVIAVSDDVTKISMLEGEGTVRGGRQELGGHILRAGEQAIIRRDPLGGANPVEIRPIPPEESADLDEKVTIACSARKTVYFEARDRAPDDKADGRGDSVAGASDANLFDSAGTGGSQNQVLTPVELLPPKLPVEYTVSNAKLSSGPE